MVMGRPSKFNEVLSERIVTLYAEGYTDDQVAQKVGISVRALRYWKGKHEHFLQALKDARDIPDSLVEASLFQKAIGYRHPEELVFFKDGKFHTKTVVKHYAPDTVAAMFWLQNRRPDQWRNTRYIVPQTPAGAEKQIASGKKSFEDFCVAAGYPHPYPKQIEMMNFGINESGARLLLGARGYGKTDYVVILGIAYKLYLDPKFTVLIITKSKERNAAILREISQACKANGMVFEKENSTCLRVAGLLGKDHSVSSVTIKTVTLRGRHPDMTVMDDPVTPDDISEATRLHVERVYNEVNKLCSNILIVGQPVHKFDLYETLRPLLNKMEVVHGSIPELDHDLEAQRLAGVSEESIQASYFLSVASDTSTPFAKIKSIEEYPIGDSVAFIDPSFEGGDFTAISIVRTYFEGIVVIGFCYRKAWNHCLDEIAEKLVTYRVRKLCFETNSLGDQPLDVLAKEFGKDVGIIGKKSNTNKHSRIMAAGAFAPIIHMAQGSDKTYKDQVIKYEYNAKNDDAPDSLASCLEWIGFIRGKL